MATIITSHPRECILASIANMSPGPGIFAGTSNPNCPGPAGPTEVLFLTDLARKALDVAIDALLHHPYREADVRFAAVLVEIQGNCSTEQPPTYRCNYASNNRRVQAIMANMGYKTLGLEEVRTISAEDLKTIFDMAYKSAEPTETTVTLLRSFLPLIGQDRIAVGPTRDVEALAKRVPRPVPDEPVSYAIEQRSQRARHDGVWERVDGCLWAASQKDVAWARFEKLRTGTDGHAYRFTGIYPQG